MYNTCDLQSANHGSWVWMWNEFCYWLFNMHVSATTTDELLVNQEVCMKWLFICRICLSCWFSQIKPLRSWLVYFSLCVFWEARNVYQQYYPYFDLFMFTSDFIFTFMFSIIKVEQVLSIVRLLSNPGGICRFFFTFSSGILIKSAEGLVGPSGIMLEGEVYNLAPQGHSVFVFYFLKGTVSDFLAVSH